MKFMKQIKMIKMSKLYKPQIQILYQQSPKMEILKFGTQSLTFKKLVNQILNNHFLL